MKKERTDYPDQVFGESGNKEDILPGYPVYPESEDIYNIYEEEKDIDPEDIHRRKEWTEKHIAGKSLDMDLDYESLINDLDVPGSELDEDMEMTSIEDEENNYYSLGGDDYAYLEEDQGE